MAKPAMRNAYVVASLGGLAARIVCAMGQEVSVGVYVLFAGLMLAVAGSGVPDCGGVWRPDYRGIQLAGGEMIWRWGWRPT